jgi:hypothetical protein
MFARLLAGVVLVAAVQLLAACEQGGVGSKAGGGTSLSGGPDAGAGAASADGGPISLPGDAGMMCAPESCPSPAPALPNYLCPDGSLGGPVCAEGPFGACQWFIRSCP